MGSKHGRPAQLGAAETRIVTHATGWRVRVGPELTVGMNMQRVPSRWSRFWQRVLLGWTWEYVGPRDGRS